MAYKDRLAASRAQRGQAIELSNVTQDLTPTLPTSPSGGLSDLPAFLAEDTSINRGIQQLRDNVAQISSLRSQSLHAINDNTQTETDRIDSLTATTRSLTQELKERILHLESAPSKPGDVQTRQNRISLLRSKFIEAIQDYQREENDNRVRFRQRVERQLKIVNPNATQEEVAAAVDGGGQQIFSQALTTTTRYGESRLAYREVQERQQEILKVEQTLAELAMLFADMGTLVEQQDAVITSVETTAQGVTKDTEKALEETKVAVVHARSYRRGRWICFIIFVVVICILALVLGIVFGTKK
ncbi:syntaxin-like protein [Crassisporium funariophilum]|nr:syntaxin-like protein [Crassisporium funariophilum]